MIVLCTKYWGSKKFGISDNNIYGQITLAKSDWTNKIMVGYGRRDYLSLVSLDQHSCHFSR